MIENAGIHIKFNDHSGAHIYKFKCHMTRLVDNTMDLIYMYPPYYSVLNGGQAVALFSVLHH